MGINAIVIAENTNRLSLEVFGKRLGADVWGQFAAHRVEGRLLWATFDWERGSFLSWLTSPRWRYLGFDPKWATPGDRSRPDPANSIQIRMALTEAGISLNPALGGHLSDSALLLWMAVKPRLLARLSPRLGHQRERLGPALALTRLDAPRPEAYARHG